MYGGIHTCPTCKKTYTGIVCSPCFAKASEVDRKGFFRGLIKNDPYEIKNPFKDYYHNFNQDIKERQDQDLKEPQEQEKPTLKVYLVTVDPPPWSDGGTSNQEVVVLATDEESAYEATVDELILFEPEKARDRTEIVEIKGPFKNGSVLHRS